MNLNQRPYLLLTLATFFWAGNFIVGRAMHEAIPPLTLAFLRWSIATVVIVPLARPHLCQDRARFAGHWPIVILLAALGIAAFNALAYAALQWTQAINAFLMQSVMPVLIVALSFALFRERISGRQAGGIVLSLAGAATIIVRGDWGALSALAVNLGDLLLLLAIASYAGYSVLLRKRPPVHPLTFIAVTFAIGSLILFPLFLWEVLAGRRVDLSVATVLTVAYVAVFPSIISYLCFNRGVELVGANRAGLFIHLMPVFGSLMAIVFLGESFRWFHAFGIALIGAGIFLATQRR